MCHEKEPLRSSGKRTLTWRVLNFYLRFQVLVLSNNSFEEAIL